MVKTRKNKSQIKSTIKPNVKKTKLKHTRRSKFSKKTYLENHKENTEQIQNEITNSKSPINTGNNKHNTPNKMENKFLFTVPNAFTKLLLNGKSIKEVFLMFNINEGERIKFEKDLEKYYDLCGIFDKDDIIKYKNNYICIYITDSNNDIIGVCFITIFQEKQITISLLCVPLKYKGGGTILMNKIKEIADFLNCKITLYAIPGVVRFYKKTGFIIKDEDPTIDYENEYYNELTEMEYIPKTA